MLGEVRGLRVVEEVIEGCYYRVVDESVKGQGSAGVEGCVGGDGENGYCDAGEKEC